MKKRFRSTFLVFMGFLSVNANAKYDWPSEAYCENINAIHKFIDLKLSACVMTETIMRHKEPGISYGKIIELAAQNHCAPYLDEIATMTYRQSICEVAKQYNLPLANAISLSENQGVEANIVSFVKQTYMDVYLHMIESIDKKLQ